MMRRHFVHTTTLDERLAQQTERLRQEARGAPPGIERERMIPTSPRQAEIALHGDGGGCIPSAFALRATATAFALLAPRRLVGGYGFEPQTLSV